MNSNNENKTLVILIVAFLITGVITISLAAAVLNSVSKRKQSDIKTEPEVSTEVVVDAQTEADNNLSISKLMLDTEEMTIEALDMRYGDKNGTVGIFVNTHIKSNIDKRIIIDAVNEYLNDNNTNISYYFTVEKLEELNKELFIPLSGVIDDSNLKAEFMILISDSLEQTPLYQSGNITLHIKDSNITVLKSSELIRDEDKTEIKEVETPDIDDNTFIEIEDVEIEPVNTDTNVEDNMNNDTESIESESKTEEVIPEITNATTVIGDYRYGFYTLPGEFKVTAQDGNYIEYKSPDFITVSINYRENMTVEEYKNKLLNTYMEQYPQAKFTEVYSKTMQVLADVYTDEIVLKGEYTEDAKVLSDLELYEFEIEQETIRNTATPVDENTEEQVEEAEDNELYTTLKYINYKYKVYGYQVASKSGNNIMLTVQAPKSTDIVTLHIIVPYELANYFPDFVDSVVKSYVFEQ